MKSSSPSIKLYPTKIPNKFYRLAVFRCLIKASATLAVGLITATIAFAQYYNPYQNNNQQSAFRQEIARLDISVERDGGAPLPMKMVPRVQRGDVIRVRMLEQQINGIRPNESMWNWTFVVAYINPSINETGSESVSREINFRQDGWYREHTFTVPYDSQPIFFLYTRPNYRSKIKKFLNKNFDDVRKIGEKTLEIAGAYAQIGSFLNQLQNVIEQDRYRNSGYGSYYDYGFEGMNSDDRVKEQIVERLAQSFKINLPSCWKNSYSSGVNPYSSGYGSNDFTSRAQCVAQNVRMEDFDLSVSTILQQGGILASTKLVKKYPELAQWISVAAVAADLILRITKNTPLKILPTMAYSANVSKRSFDPYTLDFNTLSQYDVIPALPILNNSSNPQQNRSNGYDQQNQPDEAESQPISVYADKSPADSNYVSAFPIVLHKWQPQKDPEVISIPVPTLLEPCLHVGRNILKNTDLSYDWLSDPYAQDFRLVMSSDNGFTKEFPLIKNTGMSGWDLMLTAQDIASIPDIKMTLEAQMIASRGFNKIKSRKFEIAKPSVGNWAVTEESSREFSVGGKRRVSITNTEGNCLCVSSVIYKPSFGGEFEFAARANANPIRISEDGTYAWFDINTTEFEPGEGTLEVNSYDSAKPQIIPIDLYESPPEITKLSIHKGDRALTVIGNRVDQIVSLSVNGKLANLENDPKADNDEQSPRVFVFDDPKDLILSNNVSLDMELVGGRHYKYPDSFDILPARPILAVDENGEIEADVLDIASAKLTGRFDLSDYPVAPVNIEKMTVAVQTSLTDYNFRAENISIETRIENGRVAQKELPVTSFEVIDTFNMRIGFTFDPQFQQFLAGRRLQFRIRDRERGDSDWYTIKQTFVRIPRITSVYCRNGECRVAGTGLDYVGQYSTDGGKIWNPPLQAQVTSAGKFILMIPNVKDKNLLRIKLRDFANTKGLPVKY